MKRFLTACLLLVPVWLADAPDAAAQGVTTAAITGTVTATDGAAVPGLQVVIRHMPTGRVTSVITASDGRYAALGLMPGGPYTISVEGIGYGTETREGVQLTLSQTARYDFVVQTRAVQLEALMAEVERNPLIHRGRTGASTTVSEATIRQLPTLTGDFTDFTRLTPQISTQGAGTSAGGRNNRFNTVQIDGAVNNDLFGLAASGTPGGQAGAKPITLEAIQEFQVVLAPFDVRQGGFTGAGINAITRSGTNEFHGSASYFGRNQSLVGKFEQFNGTESAPFGDFSESSAAFSLGGPVLRDQLHFFVAGEMTRRSAPNGGVAIGRDDTYLLSEVQPIADYVRNTYNYDVGQLTEITIERNSDNLFGRVDWSINPNHRVTLRHNYVDAGDDNLNRGANGYFLGSAMYEFSSTTNSTVAQLNSTFGGRFFNEFRIGYSTIRDKRNPGPLFPFVQIDLPSGPGGSRQVSFGSENFSVANALDQDILEITNDLSLRVGRHNLTVGTKNEIFSFSNLFARNLYGLYQFASFDAFQAGTPRRYEYSYLLPGGSERAEVDARQLSLYAQDQMFVTDHLTVTAGVRIDINQLPNSPGDNPAVPQALAAAGLPARRTSEVPSGDVLFNPRLGFNWDVAGDRSMQVRGGLGLFSGRTPYVWVSNAFGNTGLDYVRFTCSSPATSPAFTPDINNQPTACAGTTSNVPNEINLMDPDFKFPQIFRTSLAVDRTLPFNLTGTLEGMYSSSINDVLYRELTLDLGSAPTISEGRPRYSRFAQTGFSNITDITNTDKNKSYSVTAQLQRELLDNWSASVAYTYSRSEDVTSTTSSQAFSNWRFNPIRGNPNDPELTRSNFDMPHRVVAHGSYQFQFGRGFSTNASLIYVGESGQPYSFTYFNTDINNDGSNGNDLLYVPRDQSEIVFQASDAISPQQSWTNFNSFIDAVPCLDEARGTVIERNACRLPWRHQFDVRLAQTVPTLRAQSVALTLDILNFGNLLNKSWGVQRFVGNQNDTPLQGASGTPVPDAQGRVTFRPFAPRERVEQIANEGSRYRIRLGARYAF